MRYLHLADNTQGDRRDKFAKVRPLLRGLNDIFLSAFPVEQKLSIDESMISCFGRHGEKQFIRGKQIRFVFKVWCLCTPLGYMVQFEPTMWQAREATRSPISDWAALLSSI